MIRARRLFLLPSLSMFLLLIPFTRKMITNLYLKKKPHTNTNPKDYIEGEVVEKEEDKDDL